MSEKSIQAGAVPEKQDSPFLRAAREMDLLHFEEHSPGAVFWHPAGFSLLHRLEGFIRKMMRDNGYLEARSPCIVGRELFERSGHLAKFRQGMLFAGEEDQGALRDSGYALRPMSCPNHISIFDSRPRSWREMPFRLFEFGLVFRNEPSGSLLSLFRLREFRQDDSHIFARESQIQPEISRFLSMALQAYRQMGFGKLRISISLRPEERVGEDALWDRAEESLRGACREAGLPFSENPGEGAFYGPKLEIGLEDRLGRVWQMGVIQLDYALPERFGLRVANERQELERPVLLHHAVFGSLERFVGILLESFGKDLPLFLLERKCAIVPVSEKFLPRCEEAAAALAAWGAEAERGDAPLSGKIARLKMEGVAYLAVVGERERDSGLFCVSGRGLKNAMLSLEELEELLRGADRPPSA